MFLYVYFGQFSLDAFRGCLISLVLFLVLVSSKCSGRRFSTLGLMTLGLPFQTLQMRFSLLPAKKAYDEDSEWTSP